MTQFTWHETVSLTDRSVSRRSFLYGASAVAAAGSVNFRDVMSLQADELRKRGRAMIFLFMQGGPSQLETFDPDQRQPSAPPPREFKLPKDGNRLPNKCRTLPSSDR